MLGFWRNGVDIVHNYERSVVCHPKFGQGPGQRFFKTAGFRWSRLLLAASTQVKQIESTEKDPTESWLWWPGLHPQSKFGEIKCVDWNGRAKVNCKDSHVNQVVYGQCPTAFNGHCLAWEARHWSVWPGRSQKQLTHHWGNQEWTFERFFTFLLLVKKISAKTTPGWKEPEVGETRESKP